MIFKDIERQIHPQRVINRVVFDLDLLLKQAADVAENCGISVLTQQAGHARKSNNSRYLKLEIQFCYSFSDYCLSLLKVVCFYLVVCLRATGPLLKTLLGLLSLNHGLKVEIFVKLYRFESNNFVHKI